MKKRIFSFFMSMMLIIGLTACGNSSEKNQGQITQTPPKQGKFTAGTYEGTANGYGGEVKATVILSDERIESITCLGESETTGIGSVAIAQMPTEMVLKQSVDVDMVSGATRSSTAVKEAVTQALTNAGVDVTELVPITGDDAAGEMTEENITVDLVVIGAGGAGMTAAIEAKSQGLDVIILEKQPMAGGNTIKATGGMNAAGTELQKKEEVNDSVEVFIEDTMKGGNYTNNESLVRTLAENSADGIEWLASIGAPLTSLTISGGATNKRMHAPEGGGAVGPYIVEAMLGKLKEEQVQILYDTKATKLLMKDNAIAGVEATSDRTRYTINCEAVVIATGGFGANKEMVKKYNKDYQGFRTTNAPGTLGEGILMAQEIGANVIDMEQIQVHPTVDQETSTLITESVRGGGGILVNQNGERFFNEMSTRNLVSQAIMEQEGAAAYLIFDQQVRDKLNAIESYIDANLVEEEENLADLAEDINVDSETLIKTIADWNSTITEETKDRFNRETGMDQPISIAPYYAIKVSPAIHHTMGGIEINTKAEVLNKSQQAIPGLFAAGEVTGGVHGENRIGGNAVAEVVVFGRIAGLSAAEYVNIH